MVRGAHRRGRALRPAAVGSGRGADHPAAFLEDGDLVAYQTGAWDVDGVAVGDGEDEIALAFVTLVQLVFTHNCEHGWIHGDAGLAARGDAVDPAVLAVVREGEIAL